MAPVSYWSMCDLDEIKEFCSDVNEEYPLIFEQNEFEDNENTLQLQKTINEFIPNSIIFKSDGWQLKTENYVIKQAEIISSKNLKENSAVLSVYSDTELKDTLIKYRTYSFAEKNNAETLRRENSKEIRSDYIKKVFKNYDSSHLPLHHKISRYSLDRIEQIDEANHYFIYLLHLESQIDQNALQSILAKRFFDLCYANIHLGRSIHWVYLKEKYWKFYRPSLLTYIKFLIKTIIQR